MRQYRSCDGRAARRFRRCDGAGDAGISGDWRTVYQGICSSAPCRLNESPLKDHPLNPMHDSNLVRVLARQSKTRDWAGRSRGPCARPGCRPRASGRSCRQRFWCSHRRCRFRSAIWNIGKRRAGIIASSVGASGIGLVSPARWLRRERSSRTRRARLPIRPSAGRAACLAGSCSQATLQQIAARKLTCRCCIRSPIGSSQARRKPARAGLGQGAAQGRFRS